MKTLVLYVFNELNERVNKFIKDAIFLDQDTDFLLINNGSRDDPVIPDYVIYFKGETIGYDFGAWSRGLLYNELYKAYNSFIFVSSQAAGPYLPSYFQGKWTDIYLSGLNDSVKVMGSTISTNNQALVNDPEGSSHVQPYIFAVKYETLLFLISKEIFSLTRMCKSIQELTKLERKMSRVIIENGWNIGCLMLYYKGVDFRFLTSRPSDYKPFLGDPLLSKNFSDKLFNNFYELVFVKPSRFDFNLNNISL